MKRRLSRSKRNVRRRLSRKCWPISLRVVETVEAMMKAAMEDVYRPEPFLLELFEERKS